MRAQYETRLATLKTTNYKDGQFLIIILSKLQYKRRIDDHFKLGVFILGGDLHDSRMIFLVINFINVGVIR